MGHNQGDSQRDARRGWGPFTGGQLTILILGVLAAVAFPAGAWAVSASQVEVTDATSGATAKVSASGALTVAGSVTATNASPKSLFVLTGYPGTAVYAPVVAPPSGKALVITSLDIDTYTAPTPGQNVVVEFGVSATNATCTASPVTPVEFVNPTGLGLTSITIPSGLVVPANRALCGIEAVGLSAVATAHGYLVPAASAPTGTSARGPVHPPTPRP